MLTGPARGGKTALCLELYRRSMDAIGRPGCLLLAPNTPAAEDLRRQLLESAPTGVLISPAVMTFAGLAGGILAASGKKIRTLSPTQRRGLLERIIIQLAEAKKLRSLAPLADTPGLAAAIDQSIAELKRSAILPEQFRALAPPDPKNADLAAVYELYQQTLLAQDCYDIEGQSWLARDLLAADAACPLGLSGIRCVAADGFTDFTPTQLEILALLAGRMERLVITLPLSTASAAKRLWFWTGRTLERIQRQIPSAKIIALPETADPWPGLFDSGMGILPASSRGTGVPPEAQVAQPGAAVPHAAVPHLAILESPGDQAQIRHVARQVKAALKANPRARIAILGRDLSDLAGPIATVFEEFQIPLAGRALPLSSCNIVKFILRTLELWPEFECFDMLAVTKSSYFRPAALGEFDSSTVAVAEMAIRSANILGGRQAYSQAINRLAEQASRRKTDDDPDPELRLGNLRATAEELTAAAALLEALMSRVEAVGAAKDAAGFVAAVRTLLGDLQVTQMAGQCDDEAVTAGDLRALQAFHAVLAEMLDEQLAPQFASAEKSARLLETLCSVATCRPARTENLVTMLDVLDARSLRFDQVFVLGVNEKSFPQLASERCLLNESDRQALAHTGVGLDSRRDLLAREMLLFYLACGRADGQLTVSYLTSDSSGHACSPSSFVEELLAAAKAQGVEPERVRLHPGEFAPPVGLAASPQEAMAAAFQAAFQGGDKESRAQAQRLLGAIAIAAEHKCGMGVSPMRRRAVPALHTQSDSTGGTPVGRMAETAMPRAIAPLTSASFGMFAWHRRWQQPAVDIYDGRVDRPDLLARLQAMFPENWVFSASELNAYARCPWQFFARYLLKLAPLAEPAPQLTPAARGLFCHAVLCQVMTTLGKGKPFSLADLSEEAIAQALAQAVQTQRDRLADQALYSKLWEVQTANWHRMLGAYLSDQRANPQPDETLLHRYFELSFGMGQNTATASQTAATPMTVAPQSDAPCDTASVPDPVAIDADGMKIRLRGRIDRVDSYQADAQRQSLLAVDYKTGSLPAAGDIAAGRDLQLAVYSAVLKEMFKLDCGGAYHDLRHLKHRPVAEFGLPRGVKDLAGLLSQDRKIIAGIVEALRLGRFECLPDRPCVGRCDYRQICQYSQFRAARKDNGNNQEAADE